MDVITLLIGLSLTIAVIFLVVFCWNMKSGQYDDTYTPSVRVLFEDELKKDKKEKVDDDVEEDTKIN
jgi:cbb3-type cytochrome oxidase maturation protein